MRVRVRAREILMLLSNNTSILLDNTSIRFFIPPVVFSNNIIIFDKKLVPFSLFLLKCWCTGRFTTGVVAPTSPVLLPFDFNGRSTGEVQPTTPVPCALCLSGFEPPDGRRGLVFSIFLKILRNQLPIDHCFVTDWLLFCYRLTIALLPTEASFHIGWSP